MVVGVLRHGAHAANRAGGMGRGVDLLQGADAHLGVDLDGRLLGMAEHGLDVADVGAAFEHQRRAGVAEQVAGALLAGVGRIDMAADELGQPVGREGFAQRGQEQRAVIGPAGEVRAHVVAVFRHPGERARPELPRQHRRCALGLCRDQSRPHRRGRLYRQPHQPHRGARHP